MSPSFEIASPCTVWYRARNDDELILFGFPIPAFAGTSFSGLTRKNRDSPNQHLIDTVGQSLFFIPNFYPEMTLLSWVTYQICPSISIFQYGIYGEGE